MRRLDVVIGIVLVLGLVGCRGDGADRPEPVAAEPSGDHGSGASSPREAGEVAIGGPGSHANRAEGRGTASLDGDVFDVEVLLCGWAVAPTDPAHPGDPYAGQTIHAAQPGERREIFKLVVVTPDVGHSLFALQLEWDGDVGAVQTVATYLDRSTPGNSFIGTEERTPTSRLDVEGGRVRTVEPIAVGDVDDRRGVEVDVTCDTFGGTEDALEQVLSDVTGTEVTRPSGEFVIDGTVYSLVDRRSCLVGSDGKAQVELTLEGPDGTPVFLLLEGTDDRQYARLTGVPGQEVWEFGGANQLYTTDAPAGMVRSAGEVALTEGPGDPVVVRFELDCDG